MAAARQYFGGIFPITMEYSGEVPITMNVTSLSHAPVLCLGSLVCAVAFTLTAVAFHSQVVLKDYTFESSLLLTGTPLQNNTEVGCSFVWDCVHSP